MTRHRSARPLALLALLALAWALPGRAGVLYRCEGPGGTIAYTNRTGAFTKCVVVSSYADAAANKPAAGSLAATRRWDYREQTGDKAEFPADRIKTGVVSTAPSVVLAAAEKSMPAAAAKSETGPKILRGAVYRVDRANGVTEYTNIKPGGGKYAVLFTYIATCVACDVHSKIDWLRTPLHLDAYKDEIARAAADTGVDASLLRAVIHAESAFNPYAISGKGAQGLMQLMPGTASDLGVANVFDAAQNIDGGARYLAGLLKDFKGDVSLATAAYNAGEAAVQKYGGVPPYDETKVYVQRVAELHDRYKKAM